MRCDVIYLQAEGRLQWRWQGRRLEPGEPAPDGPLVAVVDVAEEMLSRQSVPKLRGRDRRAMRARRLQNEFPETRWRAAFSLAGPRAAKTEEIILAGVQPGGEADAVLAELGTAGRLQGVYTPALLASAWFSRARLSPRPVIVALATPAGLRLVFLNEGRAMLTRLTPWPAGSVADARLVSEELARTAKYLQNVRWIDRDRPTELWLWGARLLSVAAELSLPPELRLTPTPAVSGLADPAQGGLPALVELAAARPPHTQLAPPETRVAWLAIQARKALAAGAVAIALGLAGAAGAIVARDLARSGELQQLEAAAQALEADNASAERALEGAGVSPERFGVALAVDAQFASEPLSLLEAYDIVSRSMAGSRALLLQELQLRRVDPMAAAPSSGGPCAPGAGDSPEAAPPRTAELGLELRARPEASLTNLAAALGRFDAGLVAERERGWQPTGRLADGLLVATLKLDGTSVEDAGGNSTSVCLARAAT